MFGLVFLLLLVVPVVELYVLFQVADGLGWGVSFLSLIAISLLGGVLIKWQTTGAFARITNKIGQGQVPSKELVDGALMVFGGALLLTPGFFTDAIGLAMYVPPIRALVRRVVLKRLDTKVTTLKTEAGMAFGTTFGGGGFFSRTSPFIDVDEVHVDEVNVDRIPNPELPSDGF